MINVNDVENKSWYTCGTLYYLWPYNITCLWTTKASGNELVLVILKTNLLIVMLMTIEIGTHVPHNINSDATTFRLCKQQQRASGNKILVVIH